MKQEQETRIRFLNADDYVSAIEFLLDSGYLVLGQGKNLTITIKHT